MKKTLIHSYDQLAISVLVLFLGYLNLRSAPGGGWRFLTGLDWLLAILVCAIGIFSLIKNPKISGFKDQPMWAVIYAYVASILAITVPVVMALQTINVL